MIETPASARHSGIRRRDALITPEGSDPKAVPDRAAPLSNRPDLDLRWIQASRNTVQVHLADRTYELRETTTAIAARLDPRRFVPIHRSAIVSIRRVRAIHPWFNGHHIVVMETGHQLRMSRYQHEAFLQLVSSGKQEKGSGTFSR